jgi:hypothetical protein
MYLTDNIPESPYSKNKFLFLKSELVKKNYVYFIKFIIQT